MKYRDDILTPCYLDVSFYFMVTIIQDKFNESSHLLFLTFCCKYGNMNT